MKALNNSPLTEHDPDTKSPRRSFRLAAMVKMSRCWLALALTFSNIGFAQSTGVLHIWGDTSYDLYSELCGSPTRVEGVTDFHADTRNRMMLRADGSTHIWGIGRNTYPSIRTSLRNVASLDGGREVTYAILRNGAVVPIPEETFTHGPVPDILGPVQQIASGQYHSLALLENGTVVGWGQDPHGAANPPSGLQNVTAIAVGSLHSVALKEDGSVIAWGEASHQRLDVPSDLRDVISIAAGDQHTVALLADGSLRAWGNLADIESIPTDPRGFTTVAAGGKHTIALDRKGSIQVWGATAELTPTIPSDIRVSAVFAGSHYTAVIADRAFPILEEPLQNLTVHSGQTVTMAINADEGDAVSFQWFREETEIPGATERLYEIVQATPDDVGTYTIVVRNEAGTATTGTTLLSVLPASQAEPSAGTISTWGSPVLPSEYRQQEFIDLAGGLGHTLLLAPDGTVTAAGNNLYGQADVPENLSKATQIAAGRYHSLAITPEGHVVGWGDNRARQIDIPLELSDVTEIKAGNYHSLALTENGTVVGWGDNRFGQTDVPADLTNVIAIATAEFHNLALKVDGTVVAWGHNSRGQTDVPEGLSDVIAISAAAKQSVALRANGRVVAWGSNAIESETQPEGLNGVVRIAAGGERLAVVLANGEARILHSPAGLPLLWRTVEDPVKLIASANHIYLIDSTPSPEADQLHLQLIHSDRNDENLLRLRIVNGLGEPVPTNEAAGLIIEGRSDLQPGTPWSPMAPRFDFTTGSFSIEANPGNAFFRAREPQLRR